MEDEEGIDSNEIIVGNGEVAPDNEAMMIEGDHLIDDENPDGI